RSPLATPASDLRRDTVSVPPLAPLQPARHRRAAGVRAPFRCTPRSLLLARPRVAWRAPPFVALRPPRSQPEARRFPLARPARDLLRDTVSVLLPTPLRPARHRRAANV